MKRNILRSINNIKRERVSYSLMNKPYTTFVQGHTFKKSTSILPNAYDEMIWRDKTKEFASNRALWIMIYMMYLLIIVELLIGISIFTEKSFTDIISSTPLNELVFTIMIKAFIGYLMIGMLIHKLLIIVIEYVRRSTNLGYSIIAEWGLVLVQSLGFYLFIYIFFNIVKAFLK